MVDITLSDKSADAIAADATVVLTAPTKDGARVIDPVGVSPAAVKALNEALATLEAKGRADEVLRLSGAGDLSGLVIAVGSGSIECCIVRPERPSGRVVRLGNLVVHPDHRRHGHGDGGQQDNDAERNAAFARRDRRIRDDNRKFVLGRWAGIQVGRRRSSHDPNLAGTCKCAEGAGTQCRNAKADRSVVVACSRAGQC